jgi:tetratricopeptide (TPR) repeat protein
LNDLASAYNNVKPDSTISMALSCLGYCQKAKYDKGICESLRIIGMGFVSKSEYAHAISYFNEALMVAEKNHLEKSISKVYNNLGIVYKNLGDYSKALAYHFKALQIREKQGDNKGIANSLGNIAIIYKNINKPELSLKNYFKALKIFETIEDKLGVSSCLNNIANAYIMQNQYSQSVYFNLRALRIQEEIGDKKGIALSLGYLGLGNYFLKHYADAIAFLNQSISLKDEIGDKYAAAESYEELSKVYQAQKNFDKALSCLDKAMSVAKKIGYKRLIADCYDGYYSIYKFTNKPLLAIDNLEKRVVYDDSLRISESQIQMVQLQTKYEYDLKESKILAEQKQKEINISNQLKQQRIIIWLSLFIILVGIIAAIQILNSRKKLQDAYNHLEEAKNKISLLNNNLQERVRERTVNLEKANQKLTEHIYSINHIIRKPLANILGIINLVNKENFSDPANLESIELLEKTTKQLDEIIKELNNNPDYKIEEDKE